MKNRQKFSSDSLQSLLFASQITAQAAHGKTQAIADTGIRLLRYMIRTYKTAGVPGIFTHDGHTVTVVPTCIAQDPEKTCGLGDILSSPVFAAERF